MRRDTRLLVVELKRPRISLPSDLPIPLMQALKPTPPVPGPMLCDGDMIPSCMSEQQIIRSMIEQPSVRWLLNGLPELAELRRRLEEVTPEEAKLIVSKWCKIDCRNASFVEFMDVLTAALGCNTAMYFLGGGEAAKAAMFYMIKVRHSDTKPVCRFASPLTLTYGFYSCICSMSRKTPLS